MKKLSLLAALLCAGMMAFAESVDFTDQGYTNQQAITSYEGETFTLAFDKGTNNNAPKYYTTGSAIRFYGGNTITVSAKNGASVSGITMTFASGEGSNEITANVGEFDSDTWTGTAQTVILTISGTSGHRRIQTMTVTVEDVEGPIDPTANFEDAVLRMNNTLDLSTLFTSNSTGDVTYSIEEGSEFATLDGSVLSPVAVGEVTVKAAQAAVEDEFNAIEKTATITIKAALEPGYHTTYTSNVELVADADLKGYDAIVNIDGEEYDAIKCGTTSVAGAMVITVPAKTVKLHLHAAAWNGETVTLGITGATATPASIDLTADTGIQGGNNNYTLANEPSEDDYFEIALSGIEAETEITLTATSGKRFVVFGVNVETQDGTALSTTTTEVKVVKVLENGTLYIIRGGEKYDVLGK